MGVHSGRENKKGIEHCTFGCIRTTDEGMEAILILDEEDPMLDIIVELGPKKKPVDYGSTILFYDDSGALSGYEKLSKSVKKTTGFRGGMWTGMVIMWERQPTRVQMNSGQ